MISKEQFVEFAERIQNAYYNEEKLNESFGKIFNTSLKQRHSDYLRAAIEALESAIGDEYGFLSDWVYIHDCELPTEAAIFDGENRLLTIDNVEDLYVLFSDPDEAIFDFESVIRMLVKWYEEDMEWIKEIGEEFSTVLAQRIWDNFHINLILDLIAAIIKDDNNVLKIWWESGRKLNERFFYGSGIEDSMFIYKYEDILEAVEKAKGEPMKKFVPLAKQSKKKQREHNNANRSGWGVNPATKVVPVKKKKKREEEIVKSQEDY